MERVNIEAAARSALQQLTVTDSAVTAQNLGKVIRETYAFYLSRSEVESIIAVALAISNRSGFSSPSEDRDVSASSR